MNNLALIQRWANSSTAMPGTGSFAEIAWMRGCVVIISQKGNTQDE